MIYLYMAKLFGVCGAHKKRVLHSKQLDVQLDSDHTGLCLQQLEDPEQASDECTDMSG